MRPRQIARTHEEFVDDLPTCELEGRFEKLGPFFAALAPVLIEPVFKRSMLFLKREDHRRIVDSRIYFETVPYDACIGKESGSVSVGVGSDLFDRKLTVCFLEVFLLLEDRVPAEASLIDLKHKSLKELVITVDRESILRVVIDTMDVVFLKSLDVCTIGARFVCHRQ